MLPPDQRLQKNADFRRVYAQGRSFALGLAVLYVWKRDSRAALEDHTGLRIGFVVSKKQGKAVVRNRIKRRLREVVRLQIPELHESACDVIFVARSGLKTATHAEIQTCVKELLRRAGLAG